MNYQTVTPETESSWRMFVDLAIEVFDKGALHIEYDEFVQDLPTDFVIWGADNDDSKDYQVALSSAALEQFRAAYGYVRSGSQQPQGEWL